LAVTARNFRINDKCTIAMVSAQPFASGHMSGTNNKAGSLNLLPRFVSPKSIKENFIDANNVLYPPNV
jgi:1-pyrroline-5-carboxylate dehydrogenase